MGDGRVCPKCGCQAAELRLDCPECGVIYDRYDPAVEAAAKQRLAQRKAATSAPTVGGTPGGSVVVTDIRIPFWSMVMLLVKFAVASIPALIILTTLVAFALSVLGSLFRTGAA